MVEFVYLTRDEIRALRIKNPDMGRPNAGWFYSEEAGSYSGPYGSESEARQYWANHQKSIA